MHMPYLSDRKSYEDATELIATFGANAGYEAAARADVADLSEVAALQALADASSAILTRLDAESRAMREEAARIAEAGGHALAAEEAHFEDLVGHAVAAKEAIAATAAALARIDVAAGQEADISRSVSPSLTTVMKPPAMSDWVEDERAQGFTICNDPRLAAGTSFGSERRSHFSKNNPTSRHQCANYSMQPSTVKTAPVM